MTKEEIELFDKAYDTLKKLEEMLAERMTMEIKRGEHVVGVSVEFGALKAARKALETVG